MEKIERKNVLKREKAITLIALVVTIIVLLILARNFYFNVKSGITGFYNEQQMQKQ